MRQTFDHAMAWLRADDIAPEPGQDPRALRADEALRRRATLFKSVFGSAGGELVLQTILEASLFKSPVDHRLGPGEYERFAQLRQGQNQLAAVILSYIDLAETLERQDHELQTDVDGPADLGAGGGRGGSGSDGDAGPGDGRSGDWSVAVR